MNRLRYRTWMGSRESLRGILFFIANFLELFHLNDRRAWIFIIEGLLSVVVGAASFFILQDFPDTARFLTEAERALVISRLQNDGQFSAGGEVARWKYIWDSIIDWKTWVGSELSLFETEIGGSLTSFIY